MDQDTGEPSDQLSERALHMLKNIKSNCTTVTQVLETKDEAIYNDIQAGLDRANKKAVSNAQKVSDLLHVLLHEDCMNCALSSIG